MPPHTAAARNKLMNLMTSQAMKNCKDNSRKISKLALEIATSIETAAAVTRHRGEVSDASISVKAALGATREYVVSLIHHAACSTAYELVTLLNARASCAMWLAGERLLAISRRA